MVWGFADESDAYAEAILDNMPNLQAHVPSLWPLEVANALLVGERRHRITPADAARFLAILAAFPITVDDQTVAHAWGDTMHLARATTCRPTTPLTWSWPSASACRWPPRTVSSRQPPWRRACRSSRGVSRNGSCWRIRLGRLEAPDSPHQHASSCPASGQMTHGGKSSIRPRPGQDAVRCRDRGRDQAGSDRAGSPDGAASNSGPG